jgi:glycosyltransferase involved in cell wall biosynthesis
VVSSAIAIGSGTLTQSRAVMRVLLLHNRYRRHGGEERAVADIASLLGRRGHIVEVLSRSSGDVGRGRAARGMLSGGVDPEEVGRAVSSMRADVVHAHNIHPLFGWRALAAARAAGAAVVLHLHNFRLFCAIAVAYRDGGVCFRCRGRDTRPGLRLRCRGSVAEAAVYAAGLSVQQARLFEHVDRFVVVSSATEARLHELGLPAGTCAVLPNFVAADGFVRESVADRGEYALVAGRLVEEKGFDTAIAAARAADVPLVVAGEGPDGGRLRARGAGAAVRFTGWVSPGALAALRTGAAVVLAPSRWEEPCPYAVLDALAAGVPVLASDLGGLPSLVGAGAALPAADVDAWASALAHLWRDRALRLSRGREALAAARERFGEERYYSELLGVYEDARAASRDRARTRASGPSNRGPSTRRRPA